MPENIAKSIGIINRSIIIAIYFIFWVMVTFLLPLVSIGLRLYSKEVKIKSDPSSDNLKNY